MLYRPSDRSFGTNCITENGHEIWNLECDESPQVRLSDSKRKRQVLDLRGIQVVRWQNSGTDQQRIIIVSTEKAMKIID
jgi:hypothetical protein